MLFLEGIRFGKDTESDTKKEPEFAGLVNNGMTCYMNSLLQTLFHIKEIPSRVFEFNTCETGTSWALAF